MNVCLLTLQMNPLESRVNWLQLLHLLGNLADSLLFDFRLVLDFVLFEDQGFDLPCHLYFLFFERVGLEHGLLAGRFSLGQLGLHFLKL